jgi:hypothetical protein
MGIPHPKEPMAIGIPHPLPQNHNTITEEKFQRTYQGGSSDVE